MGLRNLAPQPVATDWVTTTDIGGTGTSIVESAFMQISLPADAVDFWLEVQFTQQRISGTGATETWVAVKNWQGHVSLADNSLAGDFYTTKLPATGPVSRSVRIQLPVVQSPSVPSEVVRVIVRSRNTDAASQWSVTNIRARLIYRPL